MTSNQSISSSELLQFLNDIESNINDQDTDFHKLIFYLFRFTNEKLNTLQHEETSEQIELLSRLITTIDLVLSKKIYLLKIPLTQQELSLIHIPENFITVGTDCQLYQWCIIFARLQISRFTSSTSILNQLKRLIILIINLVCSKLHSFKEIKNIRTQLLTILGDDLNYCLQNLAESNSNEYQGKLASGIHFFSIVNDHDISEKLSVNLNSYQQQFESYSRKIWFTINEISLESTPANLKLLDTLKSVFILLHLNNIMLNRQVTWVEIGLLMNWIVEFLRQDFNALDSATDQFDFVHLNHSISLSLFKIYLFCLEKDRQCPDNNMVENFMTFLNFKAILAKLVYDENLPKVIKKTLNIIQHSFYSKKNHDAEELKIYKSGVYRNYVDEPFGDPELESLRLKTREFQKLLEQNNMIELLSFVTGEMDEPIDGLCVYDLKEWIECVKDLTVHNRDRISQDKATLYTLATTLGYFPCILINDFDYSIGECTKCGSSPLTKNYFSDIDPKRVPVTSRQETAILQQIVVQFFIPKIIATNDSLLTCNVLILIFKLYASFSPVSYMADHEVIDFLLTLLANDNNRDVRMLVTRILPLYLIQLGNDKQLDETFKYIFQKITAIDFSSPRRCHFGESTIRAVAELATVSNGERLCAIYFKLIDWLSEPNQQHTNYVYCGILDLASTKSVPPHKLLSPYLPSVADMIIKNSRVLEKILQVLGVTRKYFLNRNKEYIVPRILEYYKDPTLISQIADAAGVEIGKLLASCLSRILAFYLVKDGVNEKYIVKVLSNVCPDYKLVSPNELFTRIGEITWYILLEIQVDDNGGIKNLANISKALECVASHMKLRDRAKPLNVASLIEDQVLLLVQMFSDVTHSLRGAKPFLELKHSFFAIQFIIQGHVEAITSALGQLSTCLQATLEEPDYHVLSLSCWNELVNKLPQSHLISLIDIIISLIFQKFESFGSEAREIALQILQSIYKQIKDERHNCYVLYYLSLPFLPYMRDYQVVREFKSMKSPSKPKIFKEFNRRLLTSNVYVVKQALFDLYNYCQQYQDYCQSEYFKDPTMTGIMTALVRTILDTAAKFRNKNPKISSECARVLSVIGALDANKFHYKTVNQLIVIKLDFESTKEVIKFLVDLIENHLLKIFWASNDPHKQLFAAYSMQKLLLVMGLDERVLTKSEDNPWKSFSDVGKSTLTPLLKSKYAAPKPKSKEIEFPYFKLGMKYETWLVDITLYLLKAASLDDKNKSKDVANRKVIFGTCAVLIHKDPDIPLCQHLLKYVALSHVVNDGIADALRKEFLHIFSFDTKLVSPERAEQLKLCYQTIFSVFDYFNEWTCAMREHSNKMESQTLSDKSFSKVEAVQRFSSFPQELIATKAAECDAYERTIMYLENCYRDGNFGLSNIDSASTLQSMYANLDDYDALNGILKMFSTNNLRQKLSTFQYSDNWSLAHESFEVLGTTSNGEVEKTKLLESLNQRGLYDEALSTLAAATDLTDLTSIPLDWSMTGIRSAVFKGDAEQLRKWLMITNTIGTPLSTEGMVDYEFAKCINFIFDMNLESFTESMNKLCNTIGSSLVTSVSSNFTRNIALMNQLHAIHDIELIMSGKDSDTVLKARLSNVDQDFDTQRSLITLHNVAYNLSHDTLKVSGNLLLESQMARKNGRLDISTRCIVQAMALNDENANVEFAHLLWEQGKQSEAIKSLYDILKEDKFNGDQKRKAQVYLQYANWLGESNHLSAQQIIQEYNTALQLDMLSEKCHYDLGKYYNKLMDTSDDKSGLYQLYAVKHYSRAVSVGTNYVFEALPKLITIWLDFANLKNETATAFQRQKLNAIILEITLGIKNIPRYSWFTVITQVLSRIVHQHEPSFEALAKIVMKVVRNYPEHALWYVLSHTKSTDKIRRSRVKKILHEVATVSVGPEDKDAFDVASCEVLSKHIDGARRLFEKLIGIASFKVDRRAKKKVLLLSKDFQLQLTDPINDVVIPVQSNLQIRLPTHGLTHFKGFNRASSVTFDGFDEKVNIFHSLQMPKQVVIRGSDGKAYPLMVKDDDTRKDAKVVEFTTMVNRILTSSTEARKRGLQILNYSVIPLSERYGVIEFVLNVQTMKGIIAEERKRMGKQINEHKIFTMIDKLQKAKPKNLKDLVRQFREILLENPPILHNWFIEQFSDPSAWYMARNSFTRSSAVMSMVGYIVGLGDRHCENILIFKENGSVLHIDFDCLFEKGLTLPTPEIVPFRLTQNMVDAMGISGVDGIFRITCEVTGSLLRENEQILMNILETLIHDPLLDWKKLDPRHILMKVRKKLRGLINEDEGLPMNIHGQVDVLIQEATSIERLAQMYCGWAAYI